MLKINSENGSAMIKINSKSLAEISYDLIVAVRAIVEAIDEKDEDSGKCMRLFIKDILPELGDPDTDLSKAEEILDKAIAKNDERLQEERKEQAKKIRDLVKGDEILTELLKSILEDEE